VRDAPDDADRRLFVAVPLPDPARESIARVVESVKAQAQPDVRDVRWVRLEGLHLTLRFLGPTPDAAAAALGAAVDATARRFDPFEVSIAGGGAFPSVSRPRALWLGVEDGSRDLAAVAAALDDALQPLGWPRSERPFRPHLTLARSDGVRSGPAVARRLVAAGRQLEERFVASSIVLFETISGTGRSRYEALHEARFERSRDDNG
jgi:2'-5' RNA ligase